MMAMIKRLPARIRISIAMFVLYIILLTLFRVGFFLVFFEEMRKLSLEFLFKSIFIGLRFDARLVVIIILPFLLYLSGPFEIESLFRKRGKSIGFLR